MLNKLNYQNLGLIFPIKSISPVPNNSPLIPLSRHIYLFFSISSYLSGEYKGLRYIHLKNTSISLFSPDLKK